MLKVEVAAHKIITFRNKALKGWGWNKFENEKLLHSPNLKNLSVYSTICVGSNKYPNGIG